MTEPFPPDELDRIRDNEAQRCSGCGCVPRLEHDGLKHWWHKPACPVAARIREITDRGRDRSPPRTPGFHADTSRRETARKKGNQVLKKGSDVTTIEDTDRAVRGHIDRYREIVASRIKARHPIPWDRQRFLTELWADVPDLDPATAAGLAEGFDRAVRDAHGSMARFRKFTADL